MFIKIPFESNIEFKTNISEITKMSLEHDFNVNDGVVLGNFYVSGEYKAHEVSINVEPFKYTLPFTVELRDDLVKDTLEFNIEDFSYEIVGSNTLKVNIEYSITGEVRNDEDLFERVDDLALEEEINFIDDFLEEKNQPEETRDEEIKNEEVKLEMPKDDIKDDIVKEEVKPLENKDRLEESEEKTIMETIKDSDDTFVTYHVHIMKENETIEGLCTNYQVNKNFLEEYNNLDNINTGDKILIPKIDE